MEKKKKQPLTSLYIPHRAILNKAASNDLGRASLYLKVNSTSLRSLYKDFFVSESIHQVTGQGH